MTTATAQGSGVVLTTWQLTATMRDAKLMYEPTGARPRRPKSAGDGGLPKRIGAGRRAAVCRRHETQYVNCSDGIKTRPGDSR